MNSIKVCEYSRSRSFHDDLILQDQASGERSQDQWSSGSLYIFGQEKKCYMYCYVSKCLLSLARCEGHPILTYTFVNESDCL